MKSVIPMERIQQRIFLIRGQKVMLDLDLARLYQVTVGRLNEAVKRNRKRFPGDFMFQLSREEHANLKSQSAISSFGWGGRRHFPYAFTEQGVAMLSSVLRSERAVQVNIAIMRAFVTLREMVASNKEFAARLGLLERQMQNHGAKIENVFEAIRQLTASPVPGRRRIGFRP